MNAGSSRSFQRCY